MDRSWDGLKAEQLRVDLVDQAGLRVVALCCIGLPGSGFFVVNGGKLNELAGLLSATKLHRC